MMHTFGSVTSSTVHCNVKLPATGGGTTGGGGGGPASVPASKKQPVAPSAKHAPIKAPNNPRHRLPMNFMHASLALARGFAARRKASRDQRTRIASSGG